MEIKSYIPIFFFLFSGLAFGQVEFSVEPNRTKIGLNETLWIKFAMNIDDDTFQPPNFKRFRNDSQKKIKSGAFSIDGTNITGINGQFSTKRNYTYRLKPIEKGIFYIESASIKQNGKVYKTEPFEITITDSVKNPDQSDVEIYLIAESNPKKVYEGGLITVDYKLLFDREVTINNVSSQYINESNDSLDFKGYRIQYEQIISTKKVHKRKIFETVEYVKDFLFPLKTGSLTIPHLQLEIELLIFNGHENKFGKEYDRVTKTITTINPIKIKAKRLPKNKGPESFSGLLGKYNFSQTISQSNLKLGETFDIVITVEGTGNQLISPLPKPNVSEGLEIINTKEQKPMFFDEETRYVLKTTYTIKPKYLGKHLVKKLMYDYFNPVEKEYVSIIGNEQIITVTDKK